MKRAHVKCAGVSHRRSCNYRRARSVSNHRLEASNRRFEASNGRFEASHRPVEASSSRSTRFDSTRRSFEPAFQSFDPSASSFKTSSRSFETPARSFQTGARSLGMVVRTGDLAIRRFEFPGHGRGPSIRAFHPSSPPEVPTIARFPQTEPEIAALAPVVRQGSGSWRRSCASARALTHSRSGTYGCRPGPSCGGRLHARIRRLQIESAESQPSISFGAATPVVGNGDRGPLRADPGQPCSVTSHSGGWMTRFSETEPELGVAWCLPQPFPRTSCLRKRNQTTQVHLAGGWWTRPN